MLNAVIAKQALASVMETKYGPSDKLSPGE